MVMLMILQLFINVRLLVILFFDFFHFKQFLLHFIKQEKLLLDTSQLLKTFEKIIAQ